MNWTIWLIPVCLLIPLTAGGDAVNTANRDSAVGVGLRRNYRFNSALPWINALKMGEIWRQTPGGGGACTQNNEPYDGSFDANGYPQEIGSRVCAHTRVFADYEQSRYPLGEWVLRFDGDGDFEVRGFASGLRVSGQRGTFDVGTEGGSLYLGITDLDPADPLHDIRLYPPGGVCAANTATPYDFEPWSYCSNSRCQGGSCEEAEPCGGARPHCIDLEEAAENGGATFHPLWLKRMRHYRTFRFMDWLHTNHSQIVEFSDYTPENYYTYEYSNHQTFQNGNPNPGQVPPVVAARLCNVLNAECYFNVPHQASDATIQQLVTVIRDTVAPHLPVYLEYSNEVWNGIFAQNEWAVQAADALPDSVFDGTNCFASGRVTCADSFVGMRTFQMCEIAQEVFDARGQGDRLVCVLGRQGSDANKTARSLDCPRWLLAPGGDCYSQSDIDAVAIAPYFGDPTDCAEANSVSELISRMEDDIDQEYSLAAAPRSFVTNQFEVLNERGLDWPLLTYEGGSHQSSASSPVCAAAVTDTRVRDVYMTALDAWKDHADVAGRNIRQYIQFDSISPYGSNLFGARGSWHGETSEWPKEAGLLDWAAAPGNACWWEDCTIPSDCEPDCPEPPGGCEPDCPEPPGGCEPDCPPPPGGDSCGDGNIDSGEECDDGNTIDGDGCSAACRVAGDPLVGDVKLRVKLNFKKPSKDQISLTIKHLGLGDTPEAPADLSVEVGGNVQSFPLDAKGKYKSGDIRAKLKRSDKDGSYKLKYTHKKGSFAADFSDEDLTERDAKDDPVSVEVRLQAGVGAVYSSVESLTYKAKVGKRGTAK